jgi:hypothetical protein
VVPLNQLVSENQNRDTVSNILGSIVEVVDYSCPAATTGPLDIKKLSRAKRTKESFKQDGNSVGKVNYAKVPMHVTQNYSADSLLRDSNTIRN